MAAPPQHGGVVDESAREKRPRAHRAVEAQRRVVVALGVLPLLDCGETAVRGR